MDKQTYTESNMRSDLLRIIRTIEDHNWRPQVVMGIARGGLIPGNYLSQWFDVPLVSYHLSLRDHTRIDNFDSTLIKIVSNKKVLIVDDICDTGETFAKISDMIQHIECAPKFCSLIHNLGQKVFEPHFYGSEVNKAEKNVWIDFFWEYWWEK